MGIDKSMSDESPIAIMDGIVWQYGRVPSDVYASYGGDPTDHEEWLVEHHSYAKSYRCFHSEQEMQDFLDLLPYGDNSLAEEERTNWHSMTDEQRKYILTVERPRRRRELAEKRRAERTQRDEVPTEPCRQFVEEVRNATLAIIERHVLPFAWWEDPKIDRQLTLILVDALRRFGAKLQPAAPLPIDRQEKPLQSAVKDPSCRQAAILRQIKSLLKQLTQPDDVSHEQLTEDQDIPF